MPLFQSTLPVGGGTRDDGELPISPIISIHPPRGGRDEDGADTPLACRISIHPPRVGRDARWAAAGQIRRHFNPPSPRGEGRVGDSPLLGT